MRLGFYNSCVLDWDLDATLAWAADHDFDAVELHAGPRYAHVAWDAIAAGRINPIAEAQERHDVAVGGIMYGPLPYLSADAEQRKYALSYIEMLLRAAARSGVPVVSTFTGRDPDKTLEENLDGYTAVFSQVAEFAEQYEVNLAFENCPMYEHWPYRFNIAVAPLLWREMFVRVPCERFGLNLDPSHLVWQGIDYAQAVIDFADRIHIAQAKDTEVRHNVLRDEGMLTLQWWRHRIPSQGDIDWSRFTSALHEIGYDGVLSIEHEDPVWSGTTEKVTHGLDLARRHLRQFL